MTPNVISMSKEQKIIKAMELSLPHLVPEARRQIEAMLTSTSVAIIAAGLAVWAASHLFGAGEILDVVLLGLGLITLGAGAVKGGEELAKFTMVALNARTPGDLDIAGQHFARAIDILGITAVSAVLMKQSANAVVARGMPKFQPKPVVGPPPPPGFKPAVRYVAELVDALGRRAEGSTSAFGEITLWIGNTVERQKHVLLHELGHQIFAPKLAILREFRATASMSGYLRSAWLRFLEEALVEARATFIQQGAADALLSLSFPLKKGYVTITQLFQETLAFENIVIGGMKYGVYLNELMYSAMPENVCEAD